MKKLFFISILLTIVCGMHADNLYVANFELTANEEKEITIGLNNPDHQYVAFQFDLVLPDGVSIALNEKGKLAVSLNEDRINDHTMSVEKISSNTYRFVAFSLTNAKFYGTSGALVNVTLKGADNLEESVKTASITGQAFTDNTAIQQNLADISFQITTHAVAPVITADKLYVEDFELTAKEEKQIAIELNNPDHQYVAFQFDLKLPDGVSIALNEKGKLVASLNEDRIDNHTMSVENIGSNTYRFVAFSMTNALFYGTSGALVYVTVKGADNLEESVKTASITGQAFTDNTATQQNLADISFQITTHIAPIPMITADNKSRAYGEDNPELTYTVTEAELTGVPELTTTATKTSPVGTYPITVSQGTVVGNYNSTNGTLTVTAKNIATVSIGAIADQTFTGTAIEPTVTVTDGEPGIISSDDYDITYSNNTNVGEATVTLTGKGNYTGTKTVKFNIVAASGSDAVVTLAALDSYVYNGQAKTPAVTSVKKGTTTIAASDYDVTYANNTNVGEATVTVTFKNNYTGTATAKFTITAKGIADVTVGAIADQTFTGTAIEPTVTVTDGEPSIITSDDYDITYSNNTNAGEATVTLTGKGNYTGTKTVKFNIVAASGSDAVVTLAALDSYVYNGQAKTPAVTSVMKGTTTIAASDYDVTYTNNTNVGEATVTVTFKNNYTGTATAKFAITAKGIADVTVGAIADQTFTGTAIEPTVTVTDGEPSIITSDDYDITYSNNTNVGEATVTLTGKGNYTGTKTVKFNVIAKPVTENDVTITGVPATVEEGQEPDLSALSITCDGNQLTQGVDYTVNVDKVNGIVTITFIGNYSGVVTVQYEIVTGIGFISADDENVEWYSLSGQRIETPRRGTYIMRKNGKARTVVVK